MNLKRITKDFGSFVEMQIDYKQSQKDHILDLFGQPYVKKTFTLSIILLFWSLVSAVLDSLFVGGGLVALLMGGVNFMVFLPALIYFIINLVVKIIFINRYLGANISFKNSLVAAVPYVGSSLLLTGALRKHPIFLGALGRYLKHLRKRGPSRFCTSLFSTEENII